MDNIYKGKSYSNPLSLQLDNIYINAISLYHFYKYYINSNVELWEGKKKISISLFSNEYHSKPKS